MKYLATIIFTVMPFLVMADQKIEMVGCDTYIDGEKVTLEYDINGHWSGPNPWLHDDGQMTFREALFGGWRKVDCPSAITLQKLAPEFTPDERANLCLFWDKETETYTGFSEGKKNAYGVCKDTKTVCQRVGDAKDLALKFKDSTAGTVSGMIGKTAVATTTASSVASAAGVTAVTHSSGALILTGSSGYVAGSLGSAGAAAVAGATTVTSIITAPATLIIGGAVAAGVGGAAYLCWDKME